MPSQPTRPLPALPARPLTARPFPWTAAEDAAFTRLYRHAGTFYAYAFRRVRRHQEAEDILANLWLRLSRRWPALYAECLRRVTDRLQDPQADPQACESRESREDHEDRTLLALAWVTLRRLTQSASMQQHAEEAVIAQPLDAAHSPDARTPHDELSDLTAPQGHTWDDPDAALDLRDTLERILAHASPLQRAVVLLLAQGFTITELQRELALRGFHLNSRSAPRNAMNRLVKVLNRTETDLDINARIPKHSPLTHAAAAAEAHTAASQAQAS